MYVYTDAYIVQVIVYTDSVQTGYALNMVDGP